MLLFQKAFHAGLVDGSVTLTFRRWDKPKVRPGGRYRCHPIGVLVADAIERVPIASITEADAKRAGFSDRSALLAYLGELGPFDDATQVFRVALHHGGDGDHVEGALDATIGEEERSELRTKLARLDADGRWTERTLRLIAERPRIAASQLALSLKRDTASFKADVVKLKKLGLTQSFEIGYELSPRGRAYLDGLVAKKPRTKRQRANER